MNSKNSNYNGAVLYSHFQYYKPSRPGKQGDVNQSIRAIQNSDGKYEVASIDDSDVIPGYSSLICEDGSEFKSTVPSGNINRWRVNVDSNKNLVFSRITKAQPKNLKKENNEVFSFKGPDGIMRLAIGDSFKGKIDPELSWTLEAHDKAGAALVAVHEKFVAITGDNILHGYHAKSIGSRNGKHFKFNLYGPTPGKGILQVLSVNPNNEKSQLTELDQQYLNVSVNINGGIFQVPVITKEYDLKLFITKDTDEKGRFKAYFNYSVPGADTSTKGKDGIVGYLEPPKGKRPAMFLEKDAEGVLCSTATIWPSNDGKTANVQTRGLEQAREAVRRYKESKTVDFKKMNDEIENNKDNLAILSKGLRKLELNPNEDPDYIALHNKVVELEERASSLTTESLNQFNKDSWQSPKSFIVKDCHAILGMTKSKNNSYGYNR